LNAYSLREKVIAENIANVNTPGYKRKEVSFEEKLQNAIQKVIPGYLTNARHIPLGRNAGVNSTPEIKVDNSSDLASGVNNVSVEEEMVQLVRNQIQYMYSTRMVSREFSAIRASIKGRFDR
jgi:flagellar basal-body rod protein FlgB